MSPQDEMHEPVRTVRVYSLPALIVMVTVAGIVFALLAVLAFFFLIALFVLIVVGMVLKPLIRWLTGRRPLPVRGTMTLEGKFRDAGPASSPAGSINYGSTGGGRAEGDTTEGPLRCHNEPPS